MGSGSKPLIYIGGSMRNREGIIKVVKALEEAGMDYFVEWIMPGEETDSKWQEFSQALGMDYEQALASPHAWDVFNFDKTWLDKADAFILVMPAGKSAHLELGYMIGKGKPGFIYLDTPNPERWDVMVLFATLVTPRLGEIIEWLQNAS